MRCLWIAREMPFPLDSGDRIYSANMIAALADAGSDVHVVGHLTGGPPARWRTPQIHWHVVPGGRPSNARAVLRTLPLFAAVQDTRNFRDRLARLLERRWDCIVIDQCGSGWALPMLADARGRSGARPTIVYLSHNHEETLWRDMCRMADGSIGKRLALWQNAVKVRLLERRLARSVDLVTTITAEDAERFAARAPQARRLVLTPGYGGPVRSERRIDTDCPRRVVLVGSFRWAIKQENLRQFLAVADPVFAEHGIGFDVVGDVPQALRESLSATTRATRLHGFVDDPAAIFANARIALVPELIGGGFKLKFLDYVFARLPVATLGGAAAGLPPALRASMLCSDDLEGLVKSVLEHIDDTERLDTMQRDAFGMAAALYRWRDRGSALREAITGAPSQPQPSQAAPTPADAAEPVGADA